MAVVLGDSIAHDSFYTLGAISFFFELIQLNLPAWLLKVLIAELIFLSMVYWLMPLRYCAGSCAKE